MFNGDVSTEVGPCSSMFDRDGSTKIGLCSPLFDRDGSTEGAPCSPMFDRDVSTEGGPCSPFIGLIVSSPEPSGSQGELIVYPYSGLRCRHCCRRRRQQCLNISSETALPIKAKFYMEPRWEGETKVYTNGPGHMTKVAAMPIYGKTL